MSIRGGYHYDKIKKNCENCGIEIIVTTMKKFILCEDCMKNKTDHAYRQRKKDK